MRRRRSGLWLGLVYPRLAPACCPPCARSSYPACGGSPPDASRTMKDPKGQVSRPRVPRRTRRAMAGSSARPLRSIFSGACSIGDWTRPMGGQLQQLAPDVIVVNSSTGPVRHRKDRRYATPIVFIVVSELAAQGSWRARASWRQPHGVFRTSVPTLGPLFRVGLLKETVPAVKRIAFIYNPGNPGAMVTRESAQAAARGFSLEFLDKPVAGLADIESAIAELGR